MRIAIFSDSHGRMHNCLRAMEEVGPIDHIIHLGDTARDAEDLGAVYSHIPITYVCGNNEFCAGMDTEKWIELGGLRLFICHGHSRSVKTGLRELLHAAKGADLVLFGHTHEAFSEKVEGVAFFNPGSISLPASGKPSFGILTIENGDWTAVHKLLD
ncbi:MAG: metallophosphoesterase family protein [Ruminococcaceae bacterium]|nr:metallophosphoesterase family protein [Oscillospiraceae bacterium]